jgi:hypothetical protein
MTRDVVDVVTVLRQRRLRQEQTRIDHEVIVVLMSGSPGFRIVRFSKTDWGL